jgi:hypothetical protein
MEAADQARPTAARRPVAEASRAGWVVAGSSAVAIVGAYGRH